MHDLFFSQLLLIFRKKNSCIDLLSNFLPDQFLLWSCNITALPVHLFWLVSNEYFR